STPSSRPHPWPDLRLLRPPAPRLLLLLLPATFLLLFFAHPVWTMLSAASADGWRWVRIPYVRGHLGTALLQAGLSTALAAAVAAPLVLLHHHRRVRGERLLLALHAAPFVLPVFVIVFGLQKTVYPAMSPTPLAAVVVANAYYNYGFAARLLLAHLARRPRQLEDAARVLGATPFGAFRRASLPLLAGPMAGVAVLVFLWCFASFGVVLLLGASRVETPETLLFGLLRGFYPRHDRAAVLGLLQLAVNTALLLLVLALRRRTRHLPEPAPRPRPPAGPVAHAVAYASAALALVPLLAVLSGSFEVGGRWSLDGWRALRNDQFHLATVVAQSLLYALVSATAAVALTLLVAYGAPRGSRLRKLAEAAASLPLGASSLLLGYGLFLAYGSQSWLDLRGTRTLVLVAHTLLAFPFVARILLPAYAGIDERVEDAARLLGAGTLGLARRIHFPLLQAPLLAAFGFAVALSLADVGASLLLMRPENAGLPYWIHAWHSSYDPVPRAASEAMAAILGGLAVAAYTLTQRLDVRP
ncbi:MAG TPA: ABC transporter permease subunit, partial [Candidatus Thermoplasmatota archaeon]|nr:ABC transporter permease subunit [Candidatus Thermoplasmatota archaeon]